MANTGVKGRVVDETGTGYAGLIVAAYDDDGLFGNERLGWTPSAIGGAFTIGYAAGRYGLEANPDLRVRVYDKVWRVLHETPLFEDFAGPVLDVGTLVVRRDLAEGWSATLGTQGTPYKTAGNAIEVLVDDNLAWDRVTTAIEHATRSIHLMQLYFDATPDPGEYSEYGRRLWSRVTALSGGVGAGTRGVHLEDALADASRRPGVTVRVLLNDFRWFYGLPILGGIELPWYPVDTASRFRRYLSNAVPTPAVQYRPFPMPQQTPMHSKVVVVDGTEAFIIGSPYLQEYFDDPAHRLDNPLRGWMNEANQLKVPVHDVSALVRGPAVADLDRVFCIHWNQQRPAGEAPLAPAEAPPAEAANVQLQVIRSLRGEERFDEHPQGEDGLWEAYQRAFARAQDYIYCENQYVTSPEVADALMRAFKTSSTLQVILVANNKVDIPGYGGWQAAAFERMLKGLTPDERRRFGIFTLWTHEGPAPGRERPRIVRNYVHSKVTIIDDQWATVGSANFDSVSLTSSQHMALANMVFRNVPGLVNLVSGDEFDFRNQRNSETNVAIFNDDGSTSSAAIQLRRMLWAEHLGLSGPEHGDLANRPAEGWIKLWNNAATAKLDGLRSAPAQVRSPRVLPLPQKDGVLPKGFDDATRYLQALAISTTQLDVVTHVRSFSFQDGNWLLEGS